MSGGREADRGVEMGVTGILLEFTHRIASHNQLFIREHPGTTFVSACLQGEDGGLNTCVFHSSEGWLDFPC